MFDRLDSNAEGVLTTARQLTRENGQSVVDAEHLLLALLETGYIRQIFEYLELSPAHISRLITEAIGQDQSKHPDTSVTSLQTTSPRLRRIMELAWLEASALNQKTVGAVPLLLGFIREGKSKPLSLLLEGRNDSEPTAFLKTLYAALGALTDTQGETELARLYYRRLYLLDPSDARIPQAYLHLLRDAGKTDKAKEAATRFDQYRLIEESEVIDESTIAFDAVAGIDDPTSEYYRIKRIFELVFLYPEQYRELAGEFGIANTGTLLLFGPTGVGKTYICKAMAGEFSRRTGKKLTFINARLNAVMDKWVGNTEKNISKIIEIALEKAPSLLVLDEIDSLGSERTGARARDYKVDWVNHLLIELDRLKNSRKASLVVACTNAIDRVDTALRRRLGTPIIIPLPDLPTRTQIFRLYIEKVALAVRAEIDYRSLAEATIGFTPSDIEEVVQETINRVWLEIVESLAKDPAQTTQKRLLSTDDFFQTLAHKTPSVSISKWVEESVNHLRANKDEALAQRLGEVFQGHYSMESFFSQPRSLSTQKWFARKV